MTSLLYGQKYTRQKFPIGVVHIDSPDSVKVYQDASAKEDDYLSWENYTLLPEHSTNLFWSQYGITCLKDSDGWYQILAKPYYEVDMNTGEPIKTDTSKIVYMSHQNYIIQQLFFLVLLLDDML